MIIDVDLLNELLKYNHNIKNIELYEYPIYGRNYNINVVNNLKDELKKLLDFNKTIYNDF